METIELKFGQLPASLDVGAIWNTRNHGVVVVVSTRPAEWHGEDIDVYAHVDTWFTVRTATDPERAKWERAKTANVARQQLRNELNATGYRFDGQRLVPPEMQRLDSYDDRWEPPKPIDLNPEQIIIEQEYANARADLHV